MKRLLFPLLAALALPTAVNAESYWLILTNGPTDAYEKIEMGSLEQCEEEGKKFADISFRKGLRFQRYVCIKGK